MCYNQMRQPGNSTFRGQLYLGQLFLLDEDVLWLKVVLHKDNQSRKSTRSSCPILEFHVILHFIES